MCTPQVMRLMYQAPNETVERRCYSPSHPLLASTQHGDFAVPQSFDLWRTDIKLRGRTDSETFADTFAPDFSAAVVLMDGMAYHHASLRQETRFEDSCIILSAYLLQGRRFLLG